MDPPESTTQDGKVMEATTSEDVLVVLETESGEHITLPMSALPSDFVPTEQEKEIITDPETTVTLHKKQKRKETLITRPLNEEDIELKFLISEEPSPMFPEAEVKRKPRKEYRTKKKARLALEKLSKEEYANVATETDAQDREGESIKEQEKPSEEQEAEMTARDEEPIKQETLNEETKNEITKEPKREVSRTRELPKRGSQRDRSAETSPTKLQQQQQQQPQPQPERRTRLRDRKSVV